MKEEFRDTGRYLDEDVAYIYFKRYELMSEYQKTKEKELLPLFYLYPTFLFQRLVFDKVGLYATNPFRVLFSIVVVNFIFSLIYTMFYSASNMLTCMDNSVGIFEKILGNLYFSAITFFTVGYGDCSPLGFFKILAPLEGFCRSVSNVLFHCCLCTQNTEVEILFFPLNFLHLQNKSTIIFYYEQKL